MTHKAKRLLAGSSRSVTGFYLILVFIGLISIILTGCYQPISTSIANLISTQTSLATPTVTEIHPTLATSPSQAAPSPSPTQPTFTLWLPAYLPEAMRTSVSLPDQVRLVTSPNEADLSLQVGDQLTSASSIWIYALVAPFPTVTDGITSSELKAAWKGDTQTEFNGAPILMDKSTLDVFTTYWGSSASRAVLVMPANQLLDYAWANRPSWAIVPFEALEPRWKVLTVDGQSPIHKDFDPASYPLSIPFVLSGDIDALHGTLSLPGSNRDPSFLTTVAMTGVTAMVRATASTMEQEGITYPAQDIGTLLAQADITHISNEIPFWPDCPYPTSTMDSLVFCSSPSYIDLLKAVGTDIVELTGDHFMDYGADATLYTLQLYKNLGWTYYGGGANAEEARQPMKLENHGNHIAFMGCNIGCQVKNEIPCDATATEDHPGAAQCDFKWISSEIPSLREQGYQVIFTFQHREYYTYTTEPILSEDFGLVATAGATIVSGSQAHQAHGFAFQNGTFLHYGLGNLFFDQYHYCAYDACDDAFIDRHIFYAGRYISTELITIHFVDYARPRLMTPEERARFLQIIFTASGW